MFYISEMIGAANKNKIYDEILLRIFCMKIPMLLEWVQIYLPNLVLLSFYSYECKLCIVRLISKWSQDTLLEYNFNHFCNS